MWVSGYTCVGSTAVEMMEEISWIIRDNKEELKEVVHVGNSHSQGYTWQGSDKTVLGLFVRRQQQKIAVLERHRTADEGNEVVQGERCHGKISGSEVKYEYIKYYSSIHHSISVILQLVEQTAFHTNVVKVGNNLLRPYQGNKEYKGIFHLQN